MPSSKFERLSSFSIIEMYNNIVKSPPKLGL